MSNIKVNPFFSYSRVKIIDQHMDTKNNKACIYVEPDKRYIPVCYKCKHKIKDIHSWHIRTVRDLNIFDTKSYITVRYRKIRCPKCGIIVEEIPFIDPYRRVTKRFAQYILELCKYMNIKEVAEHLDVDWKTVKAIHKRYLKDKYPSSIEGYTSIIMIDEISLKKRHTYLTIVADWSTGKVIWVGKGRKYKTLKSFFNSLSGKQRDSIMAVGMDMWDPFIKAVKEYLPNVSIVFDQFHVVSAFNRVIDKVRNMEYRRADKAGKDVIKGSKYLLLKNRENIRDEERPRLEALLKLNTALTTAYILKDYLKKLWRYKYPKWAKKALYQWYSMAYESGIKPIIQFARTLMKYAYGIINHCIYPIHTSKIEGINNKIKVIKRKAYGFHDIEYFSLIIKDSFANNN